jgi:hypothetical protein
MAKGQKRGNREHKKPKQPQSKSVVPPSSSIVTRAKTAAPVPDKET